MIFGPDDVEPLPGITALESVGIVVDPANRTLKLTGNSFKVIDIAYCC